MARQTVESIKSDLLKVPVSAYNRAHHALTILKQDPHPDNDQIALWLAVVESLAADGYAPDSSTGAPGPATTAHYEAQILGTAPPPPGSPVPSEPPDPYIE